jgi:hypothetical protein
MRARHGGAHALRGSEGLPMCGSTEKMPKSVNMLLKIFVDWGESSVA